MKKVKVSVCCLAYNHQKYIRQTLEGFISQKTNFLYEVLINDDASTDETADIIKEYAVKYPDVIKPIFQTENQYSKGVVISNDILAPMAKGDYIAFCEGDDYWSDPYKLQLQFDIMENNPDVVMVCHNTQKITCEGKALGVMISGLTEGIIDPVNFIDKSNKNPHFSSLMFRHVVFENKKPDFFRLTTGDNGWRLFSLNFGKVYYIDRTMSVYRTFVPGSWTVRMRDNKEKSIKHIENTIKFLKEYDKFTKCKFHSTIENVVTYKEYNYSWLTRNYRNAYLLSKKIKVPLKHKIFLFIWVYCPCIDKILYKFRK